MIEAIEGWLKAHQTLLEWLFVLTIVMYVGTAVAIRYVVVRMSPDYFMHRKPSPDSWRAHHPVTRIVLLVLKNLLGLALAAVGIVQSVPVLVPGVGALTILIGILLLNFPGKRTLELSLVRIKPVHQAIDWIRKRNQRPPLQLPAD